MAKYLFFDTETNNSGRELEMTPREFVRLFQYAWNDGPVQMTTDYDEMLRIVREADFLVAHNQISFDLPALFGYDSLEPLYLAMNKKVIDTYYLANLLTPAPAKFRKRSGQFAAETSSPVGHVMSWLSLDNLCYQHKLDGKLGDLKEIAKRYNPEKTPVRDLDYGLIDLEDEEFLAYAEQDVIAVRALYKYLLNEITEQAYPGQYIWREMELMAATVGQMKLNGIKVNQEYGLKRIEEQERQKKETMAWLVEKYNFPTEGKSPWASSAGKEATLRVLADFGFTPENTPDWELTPKGSPKLGGQDLLLFTEGTEAEDFVLALGALKGMRSISQLVMDNMKPDGRVHPDITSLQRSGRWSFTNPGVTIFGERNEKLKADKALFIAEEGNVLAGFDYSSADARAMAALSGDHDFARRFETDSKGDDLYDGHNLTGEAVFGKLAYYDATEHGKKPPLRPVAKMAGHAQNYNIGAYKLAKTLNLESKKQKLGLSFWAPAGRGAKEIIEEPGAIHTREMINNFNKAYPFLHKFKEMAVSEAESNGYITNPWGRRMAVESGREYTMGPALHGQSATREMMGDAILRLIRKGEYYIRAMRAIIHDELLLEFSEDTVERDIQVVKECMEHEFEPKTRVGFPINFPVGHGYGKTWKDASH